MYDAWFEVREPDPPGYGDAPGKHKQGVRWRLARNVRLLRIMRGWSQEALALEAGLDRSYVGAVERGERNPTLASVERLAEALGVEVMEVMELLA